MIVDDVIPLKVMYFEDCPLLYLLNDANQPGLLAIVDGTHVSEMQIGDSQLSDGLLVDSAPAPGDGYLQQY